MDDALNIGIKGHLLVRDETNDIVLRDEYNAIHPQNMSRIIARALANEPNSVVGRMAFGNGGTFIDVGSNLVFNPPNTGAIAGWESRIYNETYSEIVDESNADWKLDLGSAGPNVIRTGGGSDPDSDPSGGGVVSQEVGIKSNVIITIFLNENEPSGQDTTILDPTDDTFIFDEIGLYSPGKQAVSTSGYTSIDVGNKTSTDIVNPSIADAVLNLRLTVDGGEFNTVVNVPSMGTGANGGITYGDLCEGINTGSWLTGDDITNDVYCFITDKSGGLYDSIIERQSYGFLTFTSLTTGEDSSVNIENCQANQPDNFPAVLSNNICSNVNVFQADGSVPGSANDTVNPENERERLLTHIIFAPIPKATDVALSITYTLTVSVCSTSDADVSVL